ncbi:MAG TPA: aldehyde oxidase [Anaerolineae bacterium]|nr:aldehyde oxidase [Anaerolineae bacterium]
MKQKIIGRSVTRLDVLDKVTGKTLFPGDLYMEGMLYAKVLWSERPHARILGIDTAEAEKVPGVVAILTADDVPGNEYGLIFKDQPALNRDKVRSVMDNLAIVVAEDERTAKRARNLIRVEYEDLPVLTDPRQAMKEGAVLVHEDRENNILVHYRIRKGDVEKGFAEADVIVEGEYFTPHAEHAYLQPEAGLGYLDDEGRIVVHTTGQWAHDDRHQIAHILQLPEDQIRVIYTPAGGAFGGREDMSVQHLLALAAWHLDKLGVRRPVKMVWDRKESFRGHHKRHPYYMKYKTGATKDGKLTAVEAELIADAGAYASSSSAVLANAVTFATGPYEVPNVKVDGYAVYTNNLTTGAMRGFGAPQAIFASEMQMARLAEALDMDPVMLRLKNVLGEGSILATQTVVPEGVGIRQTLVEVAEEAGWTDKGPPQIPDSKSQVPNVRHGVGVACGWKNVGYSLGFPEQATAIAELYGQSEIERAVIKIGTAEVGQGVMTILGQIAAETLGIPYEQVEVVNDDTSVVPGAGSSSASRHAFMSGNAVKFVCLEALKAWQEGQRPAVVQRQYRPPRTTPFDPETGECFPHFSYGYASQIAEVDVDMETGEVKLTRVYAAQDVGKALNPLLIEGQIEGGVVQAQGWALLEDFIQQDGYLRTRSLADYLIPTVYDVPDEIVPVIVEVADPHGPYGARGVGEMTMMLLAPAILDAIHDATGIWFDRIPVKAEDVLLALKEKERKRGRGV